MVTYEKRRVLVRAVLIVVLKRFTFYVFLDSNIFYLGNYKDMFEKIEYLAIEKI